MRFSLTSGGTKNAGQVSAYAERIEIADLALSRWQNFLGQEVIYLDATLTNHGDRTLRALELTIEFRDVLNQVVLRETLRPVGGVPTAQSTPPLPPGQTRDFRASFDSLPKDWNRPPPPPCASPPCSCTSR